MAFIDIDKTAPGIGRQTADELTVDGRSLKDVASGYKQMYTAGRAFLPQEVETEKVPGRDGERVRFVSSGIRTIEVGFKIIAENEQDLRDQFARLNMALRRSDRRPLKLQFRNDDGYSIDGYLTGASNIEERSYRLKGSLTFTCYDGFFYKRSEQHPVVLKYADAITPDHLYFTPSQSSCSVSTGDQTLRLHNCTPGEQLRFSWVTWGIKLTDINNYSRMHKLIATENPEEFYIKNGTQISITGGTLDRIVYKDVK